MFLFTLDRLKNLLLAYENADCCLTFLCCSLLENAEPVLSVFICVYLCCSMVVLFIHWCLFTCRQIGLSVCLSVIVFDVLSMREGHLIKCHVVFHRQVFASLCAFDTVCHHYILIRIFYILILLPCKHYIVCAHCIYYFTAGKLWITKSWHCSISI